MNNTPLINAPLLPKSRCPTAPVEGLERFSLAAWSEEPTHHSYIEPDPLGEYVRYDQAEAIIAAKDAEIDRLRKLFKTQSNAHAEHVKGLLSQHEQEREIYGKAAQDFRERAEKAEADNAALTAKYEHGMRNWRESYEAFVAMRDTLNEHIPMPSLEASLLEGPEAGVMHEQMTVAVIAFVASLTAQHEAILQAITDTENQPSQYGTVTLKYMDDQLSAAKERETKAFKAGYVLACCNVVHQHDEPTIAHDALAELGVTKAEVKAMRLSEFDMKALRIIERDRSSSPYAEAKS